MNENFLNDTVVRILLTHAYSPSPGEAEAGKEQIQDLPGL